MMDAVQHHARIRPILSGYQPGKRVKLIRFNSSHKTEPARIDAEHRLVVPHSGFGAVQHGSISADRNQHVAAKKPLLR